MRKARARNSGGRDTSVAAKLPPMPWRFRPVTHDDLPMLHRWLNEPGVVRWWEGDDVSWDAVVREYGPANPDSTEHWVAAVDGEDICWIRSGRAGC